MSKKRYCAIVSCENNRGTTDDRIAMFRGDIQKPWKEALDKLGLQYAGSVSSNIMVCMLHFHPDDMNETCKKLRPGAVPSIRTRPFDPLWQTRDTPIKIEPADDGAQLLESVEIVNCGPMIKADESIASVSYSNRNDCNLRECTVGNDDAMLENHKAMTNTFTEHPGSSKEHQPFDEENWKSRTYSKLKSHRPVQESSEKRCEICGTATTKQEFKRHLCLNAAITCEYCTDAIFVTTFGLREHLSNAHTDLVFYKCKKCTLAFPMRELLKIHELTDQTHHTDVASENDDFDESPMGKLYGCQLCDISMSDRKELCLHMKYHHRRHRQQQTLEVSKPASFVEHQMKTSNNSKKYCKVISCENNRGIYNERLLLFCAKDPEINEKWREALDNLGLPRPTSGTLHICMLHFHRDDIDKGERWTLRPDAVPSIKSLITLDQFFESIENPSDGPIQSKTKRKAKGKCSICCNKLTPEELLESHICGNDETREIACEYCDQTFQSLEKCTQHLDSVHADDRTMYQCRECPSYFGMKQIKKLHEKFYPHTIKPYKCEKCIRRFTSKDQIKSHMERVHLGNAERSFLCSECGKSFRCERNLQLHTLLHGEPTIQCPDCPAKFHRQNIFELHYQWHQNLVFKCNECNHTCSKKASLQRHIRSVHEKRPKLKKYWCQFCDLKFYKPENLKTHLRTHTKVKPFECEVCHNFYRYMGDLRKHLQTHVGDNIYKCEVCGQGFRYQIDFKRHTFEHYKEDKQRTSEASQSASDTVATK